MTPTLTSRGMRTTAVIPMKSVGGMTTTTTTTTKTTMASIRVGKRVKL